MKLIRSEIKLGTSMIKLGRSMIKPQPSLLAEWIKRRMEARHDTRD